MNRTFAGNKIYLGFFKPQQDGRWFGNIKRYKLDNDGTIRDQTNQLATTSDGLIKEDARSWWTTLADDGPAVEKGGAAERWTSSSTHGGTRNVYTYTGTNALLDRLQQCLCRLQFGRHQQHARRDDRPGAQPPCSIPCVKGEFGDVIHSEPAVVYYSAGADGLPDTADDDVKIFVGANDGMLHCIDDDTGNEVWSLHPAGSARKAQETDMTRITTTSSTGRPPSITASARRSSSSAPAGEGSPTSRIDITNYNAPRYLYTIGPGYLGPATKSSASRGVLVPAGKGHDRDRLHRYDHGRLRTQHRGQHRRRPALRRRVRHQSGPGDPRRLRHRRSGGVRRQHDHRRAVEPAQIHATARLPASA